MNTINLKNQIEKFYTKAICIDFLESKIHPVRLVQSVKSIIGINPNNRLDNLLNFCFKYLDKFPMSKEKVIDNKYEIPEVITFADLELSLKRKKINESYRNVYYLLKVSDSKHILEFLVEFSLKYDLESFNSIWSVYKMMLFLDGRNVTKSILFCVDLICKDKKSKYIDNTPVQRLDLASYSYNQKYIEKIWIYYSIINDNNLVRKDKIYKYIYNNLSAIKYNKKESKELIVLQEQKKIGRMWINQYIGNINSKQLNVDLILILESCRASLKASNGLNDDVIWNELNRYLNEY